MRYMSPWVDTWIHGFLSVFYNFNNAQCIRSCATWPTKLGVGSSIYITFPIVNGLCLYCGSHGIWLIALCIAWGTNCASAPCMGRTTSSMKMVVTVQALHWLWSATTTMSYMDGVPSFVRTDWQHVPQMSCPIGTVHSRSHCGQHISVLQAVCPLDWELVEIIHNFYVTNQAQTTHSWITCT